MVAVIAFWDARCPQYAVNSQIEVCVKTLPANIIIIFTGITYGHIGSAKDFRIGSKNIIDKAPNSMPATMFRVMEYPAVFVRLYLLTQFD